MALWTVPWLWQSRQYDTPLRRLLRLHPVPSQSRHVESKPHPQVVVHHRPVAAAVGRSGDRGGHHRATPGRAAARKRQQRGLQRREVDAILRSSRATDTHTAPRLESTKRRPVAEVGLVLDGVCDRLNVRDERQRDAHVVRLALEVPLRTTANLGGGRLAGAVRLVPDLESRAKRLLPHLDKCLVALRDRPQQLPRLLHFGEVADRRLQRVSVRATDDEAD